MIKRWVSLIPVLLICALTVNMFDIDAHASTAGYRNEWHSSPETMHEHIETKLEKLAIQLNLEASQMEAWNAFSKSVEALADLKTKRPDKNVDAATFARFRADRVAEMANKLSVIADATEKLEQVLNKDQRRILDDESRHIRHSRHEHAQQD